MAIARSLIGLGLVFLGGACFAAQNNFVASAIANGVSALEMTCSRGIIMFLCGLPFGIHESRKNARYPLSTAKSASCRFLATGFVMRAGFGWISMAWQHMALEHLALGDVAALCWTAPLFTALLGWATLGEKMGHIELAAAFSIVIGVSFVSRSPIVMTALGFANGAVQSPDGVGLTLCAGAALTIACTICTIRRMAPMVHWTSLLLVHGLGQAVLSPVLAVSLGVPIVAPSRDVIGDIIGCGLCCVSAHTPRFALASSPNQLHTSPRPHASLTPSQCPVSVPARAA